MKKFLSLVLALVMTMSLVTVSAGAKDFADDSKINYDEAVAVMSTLGVVGGYADGSFNPNGTLTRGAAAKIICNLILGTTTANALVAKTAPYSDVPANHTFAPYIAYCQKEGIISGYADGTFKSGNTLTGYAFMKMLLGALGLDAAKEGYTGPNWSISVAKRALSKDVALETGLKGDFNGVKSVNREEACLYALNMLKAYKYEYLNDQTIVVGNVSVSTSAKATKTATKYYEDVFKNLECTDNEKDDFGRPATKWTYKGVEIGTYEKTADKTYSGSVKLNEIYKDLGMTSKDEGAKVYVNGDVALRGTFEVSKSNDQKLSDISGKIGDGTIVEVYRNDDNNHVDIIAISVYAGKISNVKAATSKKDAYVVVDESTYAPDSFNNDEFETEAFEEDDVVAYTYSDTADEIKSMEKLQSVTGELTKRVVNKSLTLGDTTYKFAKALGFADNKDQTDLKNKSEYVVYLDANGLALYIEEASFATDAYAYVVKITGDNSSTWDPNKAKLVFADGTEKTVELDKNYTSTGTLAAAKQIANGDLVRYKVDGDEYKLTKVSADRSTAGSFGIANKAITGLTGVDADSKTIFVVKNGDDYDVYTGIKNAPTVTGGTAVAYVKDDVAKIIFVTSGTVVNTSKNVTFIAGESASKLNTETDTADYYVYNAVVKGEITTVMVDRTGTYTTKVNGSTVTLSAGDLGNVIWDSTTTDSDDIINAGSYNSTTVSVKAGTGVKKVSSDEVKLAGKILNVASDVKVYLVDSDGDIESISMSGVKTNTDNEFVYTTEDGEITNLFIIEVDA